MADSALFGSEREVPEFASQQREGQNGDPRNDFIDRAKLAKEVVEYYDYYVKKLQRPYQNMVRYHKLFLNEVRDRRRKDELWRAFVPRPYAWSTIKAMSAAYNEMIFGQTPVIKPHASSVKNQLAALNIQRMFDFIFRRISFQAESKRATEEHGIQGVAVRKNVLVERAVTTFVHPEEEKQRRFLDSLARAMEQGIEVPDPSNVEEFNMWRNIANEEMGLGIPEPPNPGPRKMRNYFGPSFTKTSPFDLAFDPNIFYTDEFPIIIQRSLKPPRWLYDRTGPEDEKIFDPEAVAAALGKGTMEGGVEGKQKELMDLYGIDADNTGDPSMKDAVEVLEAWYPAAKKFQYRIILNRSHVINKNMDNPYPFKHPYIFLRNNTVSGHALGVSEFKVVERLFYEMNSLGSLRLDALTLNVIPMFVKGKDGKLSQKESFVRPGRVISSSNPQAMRQLIQAGIDPSLFKEESEIKNEINEATGTLPVVRGAIAAPRTPTGNVQQAAQASFGRIKDRILEYEGELNPFISNSLAMLYQFWPEELQVRVGGDPKLSPFVTYTQDDFLEAIESDYAFHGARTAFDNDALIAASKEWFTILAGVIDALPDYKISEHARLISQMILQDGANQIFMTEEEMQEMQKQQQEQEAAEGVEQAGEAPQAPPTETPVDGGG